MNARWGALARPRFKTEHTEFKSNVNPAHAKWLTLLTALCIGSAAFAEDLSQAYEKAYFLETAKGQTEEALKIYREIAAAEPTDENRAVVVKALQRLQEEYAFPHAVPFSAGHCSLTNGDAIHIEAVLGTEKGFEVGGTYRVTGTYTLNSAPSAELSFYLTTAGFNRTAPIRPTQRMKVSKGSGRFELTQTFVTNGWPHLSFYPVHGGNGFGGLYFGSGTWLRKEPFSTQAGLREKIMAFDMKAGGREEVLRVFGQPLRYGYAGETFSEDALPRQYILFYPADFAILMADGKIKEFRVEQGSDARVGGLAIGMTSSEVFTALTGSSSQEGNTFDGRECTYYPGAFYTNCPNKPKGWAYYGTEAVRVFFMKNKVTAYYITDNRTDRMLQHNRFHDHLDRSFSDADTGLTWYRPSDNTAMNWGAAKTFCANLEAGGRDDWRLPTINELWSLYSGRNWPSQSPVRGFSLSGGTFWSATPYAGEPSQAWKIEIERGDSASEDKENLLRILPVRGTSHADLPRPVMKTAPDSTGPGVSWPEPRFTVVGDETVVDQMTGLMWLKNPNRFDLGNWNECAVVCAALDAGGFTDWRFPTLDEFSALMDRGRTDPALPKDYPFSLHGANQDKNGDLPAYWCDAISGGVVAGVLWPHDGHTFGWRSTIIEGDAYLWPVRDAGAENKSSEQQDKSEVSQ
jgi:hypothetical protein